MLGNKERISLPKGPRESEPPLDGRPAQAAARVLDFNRDEDGHWVASLSCGHTQHLRHQPPWQNRPWVLDAAQRQAQLGQAFTCGWCSAPADHLHSDKEQ